MKPRRSRIHRIYRHLTRREPNREAQWRQIGQLRPAGSIGSPSPGMSRRAYVPEVNPVWTEPESSSSGQVDEVLAGAPEQPPQLLARDHSGTLVAALSTSLFLLGCAYAAIAGYLLSIKPLAAYIAVAASIASLLAAMGGIAMAASLTQRRYCGRFLAYSMISLAALYGVLLACAI